VLGRRIPRRGGRRTSPNLTPADGHVLTLTVAWEVRRMGHNVGCCRRQILPGQETGFE
jgi:hypothetical protein